MTAPPRVPTAILVAALALVAATARAEAPDAFVARWLDAQNRGDFAAYQALYADRFSGVRSSGRRTVPMDRAAWMQDRERMFRKPMVVEAADLKHWQAQGGTYVELTQTWSSGEYKDVGKKVLLLVDVNGALRITREELVESKRVLLPGQIMKVFIPAASKDEAEAARARFGELVATLRGVQEWPLRVSEQPPGVLVAACGGDGFAEMAATARALAPKAVARVVREPAASCPTLASSRDPEERWAWPVVAEARPRKQRLTVFVTTYTSTDLGDFGRERRGHHLVALLREEDGAVLASMTGESASDFSELESVLEDGAKVEITETYVDAPCDGTSRHGYRLLRRATVVEPDPSAPGTLRLSSRDKAQSRGKCDDTAYRDWIRQMQRAR